MKAKVVFIGCILSMAVVDAQVNLDPGVLFELVDTLPVDSTMVISPGQVSKSGNTFYFGLSGGEEEIMEDIRSDLYTIDLSSPAATASGPRPLNMPNPDFALQFFQCSSSNDENILVFVVNEGGGWNGNDLAIAYRDTSGQFKKTRRLDELNDSLLSDAYPWLSADGDRLYFTRNFKLMYASRLPGTDKFASLADIDFEGDVQLEIISCWLTNDELTMFFVANSRIYKSERKMNSDPFGFPQLYTDEFKDLYFIAGLSFGPDRKTMYIYYFDEFSDYILRYRFKKGKAW